jgi:hypothetical protein
VRRTRKVHSPNFVTGAFSEVYIHAIAWTLAAALNFNRLVRSVTGTLDARVLSPGGLHTVALGDHGEVGRSS